MLIHDHDEDWNAVKETPEFHDYVLLTNYQQGNSIQVLEDLKLYEKMPESTATWSLAAKHTKSSGFVHSFPTHPNFKKSVNASKSKSSKKSSKSSNAAGDWNAIFSHFNRSDAENLWVATEKVHGANFCFVFDVESKTILPAKRTALLSEEDSFFGYRSAYAQALPQVEEMMKLVLTSHPTATRVYAFAELFGGYYPSPTGVGNSNYKNKFTLNAAKPAVIPSVELVQREILYSPSLHFYFIDLAVDIPSASVTAAPCEPSPVVSTGNKMYLNYMDAACIWSRVGVLWAQPLFIGTFAEVMNCSVDFQTTLPPQLGLPSIDDNLAEGLVIKSLLEISVVHCASGTSTKKVKDGNSRAIVKRKSQKFVERVFEFSMDQSVGGKLLASQYCQQQLMSYVNNNRVSAVRSKIGSKVATSVLIESVWLDVLQSASECELLWSKWSGLSDGEQGKVVCEVKREIDEVIGSMYAK